MARFGFTFLLILFLYPVSLEILPLLSSRTVFAMFGIVLILPYLYNRIREKQFYVNKNLVSIFLLLVMIFLVSVFSILFNNTNDSEFLKYPISVVIGFLAAYFLYRVISKYSDSKGEYAILSLIIYTVLLQSFISLFMFIVPEFQNTISSILYFNELKASKVEVYSGLRIIGFGRSFFEAGVYSGMGLILIGYLIRCHKLNNRYLVWFAVLYAIIFLIGMLMARTTLIGAFIGLFLIFLPNSISLVRISKRKMKFLALLIFLPLFLLTIVSLIIPSFFGSVEYLIKFAFEVFINYFDSGRIETVSSNATLDMLIFPDNLKTWLIGDALWSLNNGTLYYMSTDIGYNRLIFYFGLIGSFIFFIYQFMLIRLSFDNKAIMCSIFAYFLIINIKGFADLSNFLILFIVFRLMSKNEYYINT